MQMRAAAFRAGAGLSCLFAAAAAMAVPPAGPAPAPQSPEVMLYISHPIGGGFKLPNLSLRFGQARLGANSANPGAADPMQHRELFRLEFSGRRDGLAPEWRLGFGGRVTYDPKRGMLAFREHRPDSKPGPLK